VVARQVRAEIRSADASLDKFHDIVHDLYLSIGEVQEQLNHETCLLHLATSPRKWRAGEFAAWMFIHNVTSIHIEDTEHIDTYDIDYLQVLDHIVKIVTNIPLTLSFNVSALHIEAVCSNE
jgi:hypothetical protein